jgi:hypothetical protein
LSTDSWGLDAKLKPDQARERSGALVFPHAVLNKTVRVFKQIISLKVLGHVTVGLALGEEVAGGVESVAAVIVAADISALGVVVVPAAFREGGRGSGAAHSCIRKGSTGSKNRTGYSEEALSALTVCSVRVAEQYHSQRRSACGLRGFLVSTNPLNTQKTTAKDEAEAVSVLQTVQVVQGRFFDLPECKNRVDFDWIVYRIPTPTPSDPNCCLITDALITRRRW